MLLWKAILKFWYNHFTHAYPQFQKHFGGLVGHDASGAPIYQLTAAWQAGLTNASTVGGIFGTILNG